MRRIAAVFAFVLCLGSAPANATLMELTLSGHAFSEDPITRCCEGLPDFFFNNIDTYEIVQQFDTQQVLSSSAYFNPPTDTSNGSCLQGIDITFMPAFTRALVTYKDGSARYFSGQSSFNIRNENVSSTDCSRGTMFGFGAIHGTFWGYAVDLGLRAPMADDFLSDPDPWLTVVTGMNGVSNGLVSIRDILIPTADNPIMRVTRVPEPDTIGLLATALLGLLFITRVGSRRRSVAKPLT